MRVLKNLEQVSENMFHGSIREGNRRPEEELSIHITLELLFSHYWNFEIGTKKI